MSDDKPDPLALDEQPLPIAPLGELAPPAATALTAPLASASPHSLERMAAFAIELWRVKTRLNRALPLLPAKEGRPLETSVTKLEELLCEIGLTVEDPAGRPYVEGERLDVLLFEPHAEVSKPTIVQTVKPAVFHQGLLLKLAQVIVAVPQDEKAEPKP
jgi:hypothetical protein